MVTNPAEVDLLGVPMEGWFVSHGRVVVVGVVDRMGSGGRMSRVDSGVATVSSAAPIHTVPRLDVYGSLGSSPRGLGSEESAARLVEVGPNELPRAKGRPIIFRFFEQFTDLFALVLVAASVITFIAYGIQSPHDVQNLQLAIAILGVVVLNATIGFFQEYSAERTAEALQAMVPKACRVIRDGERVEVPARELVPGDVVALDAGDAISADCRVVEAHDLSVNKCRSYRGE